MKAALDRQSLDGLHAVCDGDDGVARVAQELRDRGVEAGVVFGEEDLHVVVVAHSHGLTHLGRQAAPRRTTS